MKPENIKYGWSYHGLVEVGREWCVVCAKQRWHEKVEKKVCLACCNIVDDTPGPALQIERFLREGV